MITLDTRFSWEATEGVKSYKLQLADNASSLVDTVAIELNGAEYTPPEALNTGSYSWRVQAIDALGNFGPWSDVHSVNILLDDAISGFVFCRR